MIAEEEAGVPFDAPGGQATVIVRSRTEAELPAASITETTRWWVPGLSAATSTGRLAETDAGHGCR